MMKKHWKAIIVITVAAIIIGMAAVLYFNKDSGSESSDETYYLHQETVSYNADEEVQAALEKFEKEGIPAKVIRDDKYAEDVAFALAFQGLSDSTVNKQVLELLKKYDRKATFFVSGMLAAEDADAIQEIRDEGHEIGNNALNGDYRMEDMQPEEFIENIVRSHKILYTLTDLDPDLLFCNSTLYTDSVCMAASASGYKKVVLPSAGHFLNYRSFESYKQTREFLARQTGETVLMIKMAGPLDMIEYEPKVDPEKPAVDLQPGVKAEEEIIVTEENIVQIVEWLLKAMKEDDYKVKMVRDCKTQSNEEYIKELLEKGEGKETEVYKKVLTQDKSIGLVFSGMPQGEELEELLTLLIQKEAGATFFVTGTDAEEYTDELKKVVEAGFRLGNAGNTGESMAGKSAKEVYEEISLGERSMRTAAGVRSGYYMPLDGLYSKEGLKAAYVSGYNVVVPQNPETMDNGAIYRVDINKEGFIDEVKAVLVKAERKNLAVYDVATLVSKSKMDPEIDQKLIDKLREENEGKKVNERKMIYTTEKGVSFLFYGVSNMPVVRDVVGQMEERGYTGTFFVTYKEMKECPDQIRMILDAGNEIGIAYAESDEYPAEFDSVVRYILICQNYMEWRYGVTPCVIKMLYGTINDDIREAVSATDYRLVGHEITMIQSKFEEAETADEIFYSYADKIHLKRGCLIYFNMNFLAKDKSLEADYEGKTLCGDILRLLISNKVDAMTYVDVNNNRISSTRYTVRNYSGLWNTKYGYGIVGGAQNVISLSNSYLGSLSTEAERFEYMKSRYIGNPDVNSHYQLPGFTEQEIRQLDKTGLATKEKVLFLTFDDWGTDKTVNEILYVLEKHNVKGTFFVRTNYVNNNPNLLRAIAEEGHEVASHTDTHIALSTRSVIDDPASDDPNDVLYINASLTDEECAVLRRDLVNSYNTLYRYIGDVIVDGKASLSTSFRPPTLAISKSGMAQVLDVGFTNIVSGDFNTHDYKAASLDELLNEMKYGITESNDTFKIQDGSNLVMHMSDTAEYVAEALDIMIPIWKNQGYSFARVDEYCQ